jgi:hypothetical protein
VTTPEIEDALRASRASGDVVRVFREDLERDGRFGIVVGLGAELVAFQRVTEDAALDGYEILRLADLTDCDDGGGYGEYYRLALRLRGTRPTPPPIFALDRMADALAAAAAAYPVVGFEQEALYPGELAFGRVRETTWAGVRVQELSPRGRWWREWTLLAMDSITALEFGTAYAATLALVAAHRGETEHADDEEER